MNKRQSYYFEKYLTRISHGSVHLYDIYNKPSATKKSIWKRIFDEYKVTDGQGRTIMSHTVFIFTAGFVYKQGDKIYFALYTPSCYEKILLNESHIAQLKAVGIKWK